MTLLYLTSLWNNMKLLLVNVYLNSDLWDNTTLDQDLKTLAALDVIINGMEFGSIYIIVDFNADRHSGTQSPDCYVG